MSAKRDIIYRIPADRLDEFTEFVRERFGFQPERTVDPEPYPSRLIFISYRREDSLDITGRIYDWLENHYGAKRVFRDYDSMIPGIDFRTILEEAVQDCDVMLVIMGDLWDSPEMLRRLRKADDYVRYKISIPLRRNIPVIPVWVQSRATMPVKDTLPDDIRSIVHRQKRHVRSDEDFPLHMQELIRKINQFFDAAPENAL